MCHLRLRAMCNAMSKRASRRRIGSREISIIFSENILRITYEIEKVPLERGILMVPTYLHSANDHG